MNRWTAGVPLGRVFGFPLYLRPSWLVVAVPLGYLYARVLHEGRPGLAMAAAYGVAAAFLAGMLASVLAHELGHAVACRRRRIPVRAITLELLGGSTEMDGHPQSAGAAAVVALAGPAVSLALGLAGIGAVLALPGRTLGHEFAVQL